MGDLFSMAVASGFPLKLWCFWVAFFNCTWEISESTYKNFQFEVIYFLVVHVHVTKKSWKMCNYFLLGSICLQNTLFGQHVPFGNIIGSNHVWRISRIFCSFVHRLFSPHPPMFGSWSPYLDYSLVPFQPHWVATLHCYW